MNSVVIILKNGDFAISKRRREDCIQFSFLIAQANESLLTVKEKTINNFLNERTGTRPQYYILRFILRLRFLGERNIAFHTLHHIMLVSPRQSLKMIPVSPARRTRNICIHIYILKNFFCIVALTALEVALYEFKGTLAIICIHINTCTEIRYGGKSPKCSSDRGMRSTGSVNKLPSPFSVFSVIQKIVKTTEKNKLSKIV